jgi:hypothetical protein
MVLTIEQWTRDALDELAIETNWRAFVTNTTLVTAAGTRVYVLPINVRDVEYIHEPVSRTWINYDTKQNLVNKGLDMQQSGRPEFFYYEDTTITPPDVKYEIGLQPVPNAIFNLDVRFNIVPARLVSADTIPIQNEHIFPLKFLVKSFIAFDDNNIDQANHFYGRFTSIVDKLMRRENNKVADMPRFKQRDIPSRTGDRRLARLDPQHFS